MNGFPVSRVGFGDPLPKTQTRDLNLEDAPQPLQSRGLWSSRPTWLGGKSKPKGYYERVGSDLHYVLPSPPKVKAQPRNLNLKDVSQPIQGRNFLPSRPGFFASRPTWLGGKPKGGRYEKVGSSLYWFPDPPKV